MTLAEICTQAAQAADANVTGCAVLATARAAEAGWTVVARADGLRVRVDAANGTAPTQAAVTAVMNADLTAAGVAAADVSARRTAAQQIVAAADGLGVSQRGILLALLAEVNRLRARLTAQDSAVAAATSFADLKTRWAAAASAAPMPAVTAAAAKSAVASQIAAGSAD